MLFGGVPLLFGLPHARGGVSESMEARSQLRVSSPRPWGCFLICRVFSASLFVFPTPVGVFLIRVLISKHIARLPHARGGVSQALKSGLYKHKSSPRPWGCF